MNEYVKNKWTLAVIWGTVIAILIWIIVGTMNDNKNDEMLVNQETYASVTSQEASAERVRNPVETYFLVRADNGSVKVFWVDAEGEHLHKETNIPFELLSADDQSMLESGVKIESGNELAGFLENYDS